LADFVRRNKNRLGNQQAPICRPGRSPKLAAFGAQIDPPERFAGFAVAPHQRKTPASWDAGADFGQSQTV